MPHALITSKNKTSLALRILFYALGLLILALGITMNTKAGLGVSPLISVPYSISEIWSFNFGNATFVSYIVYVSIEFILRILRAKKIAGPPLPPSQKLSLALLMDGLQLPMSLIFTRFLNLFNSRIPNLAEDCAGTFWGTLPGRVLFLALAIILTGIGAALSMNMRIIPNPGDGVVLSIADFTGKNVGLTKNCVDLLSALITIAVSLLATGHLVGVGLGTILCVLGVGRVIAVFNRITLKKTLSLAGLPLSPGHT